MDRATRRRLLLAIALSAILWTAPVMATGFHDGDLPPAPDSITIPEAEEGDEAYYSYSIWDRTPTGLEQYGETVPYMLLTHGGEAKIPRPDGSLEEATMVRHTRGSFEWIDDYQALRYGLRSDHIDFTQGRALFASSIEMQSHDTHNSTVGWIPVVPATERTERRFISTGLVGSTRASAVCAFTQLFTGRLDLTHDVPSPMNCRIEAPWVDVTRPERLPVEEQQAAQPGHVTGIRAGNSFDVIGRQQIGGYDAVLLRHDHTARFHESRDDVFVWLSDSVPFPVQIGIVALENPGRLHVYRMESFGKTESPVINPNNLESPVGRPSLASAPDWMLNMDGIDHYFPLAEAWSLIQEDGKLRTWLAEHPEGFLFDVESRSEPYIDRSRESHRWVFHFTNGDPEELPFQIDVRKNSRAAAPVGGDYPSVIDQMFPGIWPTEETDYRIGYEWSGHPRIPEISGQQASAITNTLPRLAMLSDQFGAWHPDAPGDPKHFEFRLACVGRPDGCDPYVEIKVEAQDRTTDGDVGRAAGLPAENTTIKHWSLVVSGGGEYKGFTTAVYEGRSTIVPVDRGMGQLSADPTTIEPAGWHLPPIAFAASTGILALLIGALYFFWPAIKGGAVGGFSRIRQEKVLDHPVRAQLVEVIESEPGVHKAALSRRVGKSRTTVDHHLRKLHDAGRVVRHDGKGYTCYYPKRTDRRAVAAGPAVRSQTARDIMDAIASAPGLAPGDVARQVGIARATVHHHLQRLKEAGLVRAERHGKADKLWAVDGVTNT